MVHSTQYMEESLFTKRLIMRGGVAGMQTIRESTRAWGKSEVKTSPPFVKGHSYSTQPCWEGPGGIETPQLPSPLAKASQMPAGERSPLMQPLESAFRDPEEQGGNADLQHR